VAGDCVSESAGGLLPAEDFAALVSLERLGPTLFASRYSLTDYQGGHLFGGQLIAQALAAADLTLDGKALHSAHSYYLRAGDVSRPVEFSVDAVRDGRSFATRQVSAMQDGKLLLRTTCSASTGEAGPLDHQSAMPGDVGPPEAYPDMAEVVERFRNTEIAEAIDRMVPMPIVELRLVDPEHHFRPGAGGDLQVWFRIPSLANMSSPTMQAAMLGFLSDFYIAYAPWRYQDGPYNHAGPKVSSLDHSVWLHRPVTCGDWLFYDMASPSGNGAVGFASGRIYDQSGALVASAAQEVLFR
jgi:acyl-CoA thioesterase-2